MYSKYMQLCVTRKNALKCYRAIVTDKTGNNRKNWKEAQFFTFLFIKAEVRDEHKNQLVSSFKGENKQCLEF